MGFRGKLDEEGVGLVVCAELGAGGGEGNLEGLPTSSAFIFSDSSKVDVLVFIPINEFGSVFLVLDVVFFGLATGVDCDAMRFRTDFDIPAVDASVIKLP